MIQLPCCSDTHDRPPPEIDLTGVTAWLHGGDVYEGRNQALVADDDPDDWLARQMNEKNGAQLREWAQRQSLPVFAVRGNHDCKDYWNVFSSWEDVGGRVVRVADHLFVVGIGWSGSRYFETPGESDLEPVCQSVVRQARRCVMPGDSLVLLTHYPAASPTIITCR